MTKRSQSETEQELFSLDSEIYQSKASSSKRVRFSGNDDKNNEYSSEEEENEIEFDHEESLEKAKRRRGGVKLEGYETDSDEDVSAELYNRRKGKGKATNVDEDMDDMFADDETSSSKRQPEFDFSGKEGPDLEFDEIDGQDFTSHDAYDNESGEPIIEAFNLKSELEEGRFDEAGNYIPHKDPNAFHDLWLEGVSRVDIEKARIAHEKQEKERKLKEAREDSNRPMNRVEICKELLSVMKRGEIISDTLQRLGGTSSKPKNKRGPKQYTKKPKGKNKEQEQVPEPEKEEKELTPEEKQEQDRKKLIERLTDLSVMAMNYFNVYEDTWEQILRKLKRDGSVPEDWMPPSDENQDNNKIQWEYKWTDDSGGDVNEIYGPFSGDDMKAWKDQGYFVNGVMVRKVGSGNEFVSVTEIDF
ncbi:hypothetical protein Glove_261g80 [Diversispora epigaea]|uniref:GYF domain-containing protein n=1 Tax=Diversispora epigaea TaxID=1348612 RepID=A0A397I8N6_9GLOM|nr:hypothetical protein Glove_261g80 [Diversispora epigaea]